MNEHFRRLATWTAHAVGTPWAFSMAVLAVGLWAICGPFLGFSAAWQLLINTGTTISTFLMVFLVQNTQDADARAMHTKLDELIRHLEGPRDEVAGIERRTTQELHELQEDSD